MMRRVNVGNSATARSQFLRFLLFSRLMKSLIASALIVAVVVLGTLVPQYISRVLAAGDTYYMSPTGSDTNAGSQAAPVKTFTKAQSLLKPGDTLMLLPGTYTEKFTVTKSGTATAPITITTDPANRAIIDGQNVRSLLITIPATTGYVNVRNLEVKNSNGIGTIFTGNNLIVDGLIIHDTQGHGLQVDGKTIAITNNTVYLSNLAYKARTATSGWGSGIKCRVGGQDITIADNMVYNNYGEGIAATRCSNVRVQRNRVYDNYAVNIYVDNSFDIRVERNFTTCSANSGFEYLDGRRATGIAMGEESYSGWGAQLARVSIVNNIVGFCQKSIVYFGADVTGGGLDTVTIAYNTLWGSRDTAISIAYEAGKTKNTLITSNIVQQPSGIVAWIENRTGIEMSHNFWVRPSAPESWRNASGPNDLYGDVMLAETPNYTAPSYRLGLSSPAKNSGRSLTFVQDDYTGLNRNTNGGTAFDRGALEIAQVTASPTPSPSTSPSPATTPSPTPSPNPSPSVAPSPSPSSSPKVTPSPTPKASASPSPSPTHRPRKK